MSLVDGTPQPRPTARSRSCHRTCPWSWALPGTIGLRDGTFDKVALGVRAEDVKVYANGAQPDPSHSFKASVQLLEPIGSDTFVELATGDATIVARVAPDLGLTLGQNVTAELTPGRVHLFEREHGERIVA